jgi:hypothetical protein
VFAIQDRILKTNSYARNICKENISARCRLCQAKDETIELITPDCIGADNEYLARHNDAVIVVHQAIAKQCGLITREEPEPYYKARTDTVLENEHHKLLWDMPIQMDRALEANHPDLVWLDL